MPDGNIITFRTELRNATQEVHSDLDQRISALDLAAPRDFAVFCLCHRKAFGALATDPADTDVEWTLAHLCTSLDRDLETLNRAPASDIAARAYDPLSVGYILHGSRLGTKVLRKRWAMTSDPKVRAADHYMSSPVDGRAWKAVCTALAGIPPGTARADRIISEAKAIFTLFDGALDASALLIGGTAHTSDE